MENQLGTRNMVKAVTEEFWRMVQASIHDQTLKFKGALPAHTNTARAHTQTHSLLLPLQPSATVWRRSGATSSPGSVSWTAVTSLRWSGPAC